MLGAPSSASAPRWQWVVREISSPRCEADATSTLPLQERFYFGDTVLPLFESGIPLLRERLQQLPDADNVTIAYPDEGAWKRFKYQFGDYQEVC